MYSNTPHSSNCKCTDKWVGILWVLLKGWNAEYIYERNGQYLDERIYSQNRKLRSRLRIVNQVQVHELLQLKIGRLHALNHLWKKARNVLAHGHGRYDYTIMLYYVLNSRVKNIHYLF